MRSAEGAAAWVVLLGRSRPRKTGRWRPRGLRSTRKDGIICWSILRSLSGGFPKLGVAFWGPHYKDYGTLGSI